ncbi:MAG: hypothetical protein ACSLEM_02930 [Candidatus Malihini olakiniferum]
MLTLRCKSAIFSASTKAPLLIAVKKEGKVALLKSRTSLYTERISAAEIAAEEEDNHLKLCVATAIARRFIGTPDRACVL